jgi:hypothetical protein
MDEPGSFPAAHWRGGATGLLIKMARLSPRKLKAVRLASKSAHLPALICLGLLPLPAVPAASVHLTVVRTVNLSQPPSRVDQVIRLSNGDLALRDSDFDPPDNQGIFIYGPNGSFIRKIGKAGAGGPGWYDRLMWIATGPGDSIWALDARLNRLTFFRPNGEVHGTQLLLNHIASFSVSLDEKQGAFYVGGWLEGYGTGTSNMVHEYKLSTGELVRSFLKEDPSVIKRRLVGQAVVDLDLDPHKVVWAVEEPLFELFRIDPSANRVEAFPVKSRTATPPPSVEGPLSPDVVAPFWKHHFLMNRALAIEDLVVASIRRVEPYTEVLEAFTRGGNQVAIDLRGPGHLVGKSPDGHLYFADVHAGRTQLVEAKVVVVP